MINRSFLLLALLIVFGSFLVAFSNAKTESPVVYEYVTITQNAVPELTVSEQGKALRIEKIESKLKRFDDIQALYAEVNKYEAAGWELFSSNTYSSGSYPRTNFLLRRKKQ